MKKWEYLVWDYAPENKLEKQLNSAGAAGWESIYIKPNDPTHWKSLGLYEETTYKMIFKREKP
jgi:hypothetical protein